MIYGESCDTEGWSNGCWKFSYAIIGIQYTLKDIKVENIYIVISLFYVFFAIYELSECLRNKQLLKNKNNWFIYFTYE